MTRSFPIWPPIRAPLNTREGVAEAPMEPGERCLRSVPCDPPIPLKPWRFIGPEKPLPLDTPMTSVRSPGWKMSTVICCPRAYSPASSVRSSTRYRRGFTPAALKCPAAGWLAFPRRASANASWTAS